MSHRNWLGLEVWDRWIAFLRTKVSDRSQRRGSRATDRAPRLRLHLETLEKRNLLAADLALPVVSIYALDNLATETNSGETVDTATFVITRTGATDASLDVRMSYGGSASRGGDYVSTSAVVTIPAGEATAALTITPINDTIQEAPETVYAFVTTTATGSMYTTSGTSSAMITINDNDLAATTSIVSLTSVDWQARENAPGETVNRGEFRLVRTGSTADPLTVNVRSSGSAVSGSDYESIPATVTFAAGSPSASVFVEVLDDSVAEWSEYVSLQLSPPVVSGSTLPFYVVNANSSGASVTIEDNDAPLVSIVATDSVAKETATGVAVDTATFTVTRTGPTDVPLTVPYRTSGTAVSGSDYATLTGSVTFDVGQSTAVVVVQPIDDAIIENAESVSVSLISPPSSSSGSPTFNVESSRSAASATIQDDDVLSLPRVSVLAADSAAAETATGQTVNGGTWIFSRSGPTDSSLTVNFRVSGTATSGVDYEALSGTTGSGSSISGTITIPAGESSVSLGLNPLDDSLIETSEYSLIQLVSAPVVVNGQSIPTYQIESSRSAASISIKDDDTPVVTLTTGDNRGAETLTGDATNPGRFVIQRTGALDAPLDVVYRITGTATSGVDYEALPGTTTLVTGSTVVVTGTVTIPAGETSVGMAVNVLDDNVFEYSESVSVSLQVPAAPTGQAPRYTVDTTRLSGTVTIDDNDQALVPKVGIVASDNRATETAIGLPANLATFTVTRTGSAANSLTVNYQVGGSASSGADFLALPGSVTFAAGETAATITLTPVDDSVIETSEYVYINLLSQPYSSTSAPTFLVDSSRSVASATIDDDDIQSLPKVSVVAADANAAETTIGQPANPGTFVVSRTGPTDSPMTVLYRVYGSATPGVDFDSLAGSTSSSSGITGSVTIPSGELTAALTINPVDDSIIEWNESIQLSLTMPSTVVNGQLVVPNYLVDSSRSTAFVNIADNDQAVVSLTTVDNRGAETALGESPNGGLLVLSRTGAADAPLTVYYRVSGNAVSGVDYEALPNVTASTVASGTTSIVQLIGSVTIPAGENTIGLPINVIDDSVFELSESISVSLQSAPSVSGQPPQYSIDYSKWYGSVTIDDNDQSQQVRVSVVATDSRSAETRVDQSANTGTYIIGRSGATTNPLTVNFRASGNAVSGVDFEALAGSSVSTTVSGSNSYTSIVGSITIPAGESTVALTVTPLDDNIYELSEYLSLSLSSPPSTVVNGSLVPPIYAVESSKSYAYVYIDDNDVDQLPKVSVTVTDNRAAEVSAGQTANSGAFVISRTGPTDADLAVNYRMYGNAVNGTDYETLTGTVTIPAGQTSVSITLNPLDDSQVEFAESVAISLASSPTVNGIPRYTIDSSKASGSVTIDDDDFQNLPRISVVASDNRAAETAAGVPVNGGAFVFSRTGATDAALTVAYRVYGNATAGSDYQALSGNVTFAAGESTASVAVDVLDDSTIELSEYVAVNIVNASTTAGSIPTYQFNSQTSYASVTIADDDAPLVSLTVTDNRAAETSASQTVNAGQMVVSRSGSTAAPLTVVYRVSGSAIGGVDYESLPGVTASTTTNGTTSITTITGTVVIPAGESSVALNINALDDAIYEYTESVSINLGLPTVISGTPAPYAIDSSKSYGYVYIDDNDQATQARVSVVATDANAAETASGEPANSGVFTIARTGATDQDLTVYYRVEGTATAATDYAALTGSVVIPAGQSSVTISIDPIDDTDTESAESVRLVLLAAPPRPGLPPLYAIDSTKSAASVSIADNDAAATSTGSDQTPSADSTDRAKVTDAVYRMLGLGMLN
ncbi:MAG: hypothetical protein JNM18_26410 [Planctomycetaceae bacterium]|nr:hypothetical protein [Planctomycetaceae bacterium]